MRQLDWDDLRLFLALARQRNVRGAAADLGISHSTIARRVARLESNAGVQLFERPRTEFILTSAGADALAVAQAMEDEVSGLARRTFGQDRELRGSLVLTMLDILAVDPLLEALGAFCAEHPQIDLTIETTMSLANLDSGEADLALRFGENPAEHLVGHRLVDTARAVYAAPQYLESHVRTNTARWISYTAFGEPERWKHETPFPDLPTYFRMEDMRTQQAACRRGLGIALLPCFLCDPDPGLVRISDPDFPPFQRLWLLKHADARSNGKVRALTSHLKHVMEEILPLLKGETGEAMQA